MAYQGARRTSIEQTQATANQRWLAAQGAYRSAAMQAAQMHTDWASESRRAAERYRRESWDTIQSAIARFKQEQYDQRIEREASHSDFWGSGGAAGVGTIAGAILGGILIPGVGAIPGAALGASLGGAVGGTIGQAVKKPRTQYNPAPLTSQLPDALMDIAKFQVRYPMEEEVQFLNRGMYTGPYPDVSEGMRLTGPRAPAPSTMGATTSTASATGLQQGQTQRTAFGGAPTTMQQASIHGGGRVLPAWLEDITRNDTIGAY